MTEDLRQRPNENRSQYGWRLLMHDLRNPKGSLEPKQEVTEKAGVTNIINNYPPMFGSTRFNFANVFAIVVMVIFLTALGVVLWRTGALQHIYDTFWSLLT